MANLRFKFVCLRNIRKSLLIFLSNYCIHNINSNKVKKYYSFILHLSILSILLSGLVSCGSKDEPDSPAVDDPKGKMTVLLYAVVADLDLESDKNEILAGAADIDLDENKLFVYQVYRHGYPQLLELTRDLEGKPQFQVVKVYDRELYSTDPKRISGVIEDAMVMAPAEDYGLIFWSHGTGWSPDFSNHGETELASNEASIPATYSFGYDTDVERDPFYTDKTDIDELAAAIPDNTFRYIWFDVCYMGGIETVYQLRNKCEYFIGMPTEDAGNGMPYQLTIPYLLKENPDCVAAAKEFFTYYETGQDSGWAVATVGVYHTPDIEPVADYCRIAYADAETPSSYGLQVYSRGKNGPFYDFGQYTRRIAESNPNALPVEDFEEAMDKFVIYKAATQYNFAGKEIIQENYSGLSCHLYNRAATDNATAYYRTLDWAQRVYE